MRFKHNLDDFFNKNHDFYAFSKEFFKQFPTQQNASLIEREFYH